MLLDLVREATMTTVAYHAHTNSSRTDKLGLQSIAGVMYSQQCLIVTGWLDSWKQRENAIMGVCGLAAHSGSPLRLGATELDDRSMAIVVP